MKGKKVEGQFISFSYGKAHQFIIETGQIITIGSNKKVSLVQPTLINIFNKIFKLQKLIVLFPIHTNTGTHTVFKYYHDVPLKDIFHRSPVK